jgi:GAF domain-containing protein
MVSPQDEIRVSRVVFDYAARIGQEQDLDRLLMLVADMARDLVAADRCSIWMADPATGELWRRSASRRATAWSGPVSRATKSFSSTTR